SCPWPLRYSSRAPCLRPALHLPLHDALPIYPPPPEPKITIVRNRSAVGQPGCTHSSCRFVDIDYENLPAGTYTYRVSDEDSAFGDRKSTRLNSSHVKISYAVFCLKKKNSQTQ